ncbi:type I-F CRISPR-associated endoribonuclease Cas6/Csy4 [Mixta intestinalis]|jgi:CRISPR-associated endonuclease Csy4|uniref:CRISPR-associated endonuclease Cas6f/Csy4 n=1 Tax=Mixta intestinalis TaxID=1615494 RepID=A0A6P1PV63_9GAMM|nr:type I-F CRISPR-associated endoribonuclease Cas6/Csy4 [Mixta intestinalis]QHM69952.1 CRISPR-associated endonuclease Cas6f/Csy4 [Mixta intestinalis]
MDHYQDIRLLPDPEFSLQQLMSVLFAKLHRALVEMGSQQVGVSFPQVKGDLGNTLRLHGSAQDLALLQQQPWLKGMRDHIELGEIQPVPSSVQYRTVRRVQVKSSAERLRRRSVKKGWLSEEQARCQIGVSAEQRSQLPYVRLKSASTGQAFPLFIAHGPLRNSASEGSFSAYGLSATATIPWF